MNPGDHIAKAKAFNYNVVECDGHDFDSIRKAFDEVGKVKDKPTFIVAHTIKGKGVSFMENNYGWHGKAPSDEEFATAMNDLKEVK